MAKPGSRVTRRRAAEISGKTRALLEDGELLGERKFGAIVGNDVHTGIHTAIYPGRKLAPGSSTRPGDVVQLDLTKD